MAAEPVGRVLGTDDATPLAFWVALAPDQYLQLDDVVVCERVLEDVAGAERAGVHATPSFFLGGEPLEGHWSQLAKLVPAALQKAR